MARLYTSCALVGLLGVASVASAADADDPPRVVASVVSERATERPGGLMPLYVMLASLQAYDAYTTLVGVTHGAVEQNPLVGAAAAQSSALWTIKAVSTATTIYFAEQLWRDHRKTQAIALMVVANGTMAAVAARNASVLHAR